MVHYSKRNLVYKQIPGRGPPGGCRKAEGIFEEEEKKGVAQFKVVFDAIRELMTPPEPKRRSIGFILLSISC
jgi:hypothetical protein